MTSTDNAGAVEGEGNTAQAAYWNDKAGETWATLQERIDASFAGLTDVALGAAAPRPGESVLDVGSGCGATVLALARAVGETGRVLGLDISEPMSARARSRIAEAGLTNATIRVADAQIDPLPAQAFDLLFSRFGVMFFADPTAAFANLRSALKPDGRLLFAAWRPMAENAWFTVPLEAARALLPPQAATDPDAPGPFAFAKPHRVRTILSAAGWRDIEIRPHDIGIRLAGAGQLQAATEMATRVGPLARALAEVDPDRRRTVRATVQEALAPHGGAEGFDLAGAIWLVSARNG